MPQTNLENILVRELQSSDISSLTTIIPRAYKPEAFLNKIFPPDSALIREWWTQIYTSALQSSTYRIFVAISTSTNEVVGVLTHHLYRSPEFTEPGGLCTLVPLTEDHDKILEMALVEQAADRKKYMGDMANFQVDLLGVDQAFQGGGIGRELVRRGCEVADAEGVAVFLQTTEARQWYVTLGMGFKSGEGSEGWEMGEGVVVRRAQKA